MNWAATMLELVSAKQVPPDVETSTLPSSDPDDLLGMRVFAGFRFNYY